MAKQLIGKVLLDTEHLVYAEGKDYTIQSKVRRDPRRSYCAPVSSQAVQSVAAFLRSDGEPKTINDCVEAVKLGPPTRLGFWYTSGRQLYFEVERALVVLAALGQANVTKVGREYQFVPL